MARKSTAFSEKKECRLSAKNKKILLIVIICVIVVTLAFGSLSVTTYALFRSKKKAVIILPGLFASGLYDEATGEAIWDPFGDVDIYFGDIVGADGLNYATIISLLMKKSVQGQIKKLLANDNMGTPDSLFNLMAVNEDGTPAVPTIKRAPWSFEGRVRYGVVNTYRDMYDSLNAQYGKEYDVQVFNYDFRMDNRKNAIELEEYINAQKYEEVIIVAHSNGGQVAAIYLARSQANRDKVSKYVSYSSPYYGAFAGIHILENAIGMVEGITTMLLDNGLTYLADNIDEVFTNQFLKLINVWTAYQLLPSNILMTTEYCGEKGEITLDGEPMSFADDEELWEFYCTRPWAKDSDGNIRPPMQQWLDYKASTMVSLPDGRKVLSTTLVDTTYVCGMNMPTINQVNFITEDGEIVFDYSDNTLNGDGTVLLSSAVALLDDEDIIIHIPDINHYGVNIKYSDCAFAAEKSIAASISAKSVWYETLWRKLLKYEQ